MVHNNKSGVKLRKRAIYNEPGTLIVDQSSKELCTNGRGHRFFQNKLWTRQSFDL
jgi:hypothetical protein